MTPCPYCETRQPLDGHAPGEVVRCACGALLVVTVAGTLEAVPPARTPLRPSLWSLSETIRERLAAEISGLEAYQLEAFAGQFRRLSEQCSRELYRRRDEASRLRGER
jgi:hypothetical protein